MRRRNFLKSGTAALAASGYLESGWLRAFACGDGASGGKIGFPSFLSSSQRPLAEIDLHDAVIVTRPGHLPNAECRAATVLSVELAKRTGIHLNTSTTWPKYK